MRRTGRVTALVVLAALPACVAERVDDARIDTTSVVGSVVGSGVVGQVRVDTLVRTVIDTVVDTIIDTVPRPGAGTGVRRDTLAPRVAPPVAPAVAPAVAPLPAPAAAAGDDMAALVGRRLLLPVQGVAASAITSSFNDARGTTRRHEALDILAPRGTPVLAADDGRVLKLFTSVPGGLTVYQADPTGRFIYYYAHMDGYRAGLREGASLAKGDVVGYVGTTGNASGNTPHLHFAVSRTDGTGRWWTGTPVDPAPALRGGGR